MAVKTVRARPRAMDSVARKSRTKAPNGSVRRPVREQKNDRVRLGVSESEKAVITANRYVVRQYPHGLLAGTPRRLSLKGSDVWIVPVLLTSPGYGAVGEVGFVAVNARSGQILGGTPKADVIAAGKRLREENQHELEAAFRRARTV